jgi:hypothetical protein
MNITLQVRRDIAPDLHRSQANSRASQELMQTIAQLGLDLQPLHPGASDATLAQFFVAIAPDDTDIDHALARLRACEAVESAYAKPPDELP